MKKPLVLEQRVLTPMGHNSDLRWLQLTPLCFIKDLGLRWEALAWELVRPACCKGFWVPSQLGMLPNPVACSAVKWGGVVSALPYCAGTSGREWRIILSWGLTRDFENRLQRQKVAWRFSGSPQERLLGAAGGGRAVLFPSTRVLEDISPGSCLHCLVSAPDSLSPGAPAEDRHKWR